MTKYEIAEDIKLKCALRGIKLHRYVAMDADSKLLERVLAAVPCGCGFPQPNKAIATNNTRKVFLIFIF